MFDNLSERLQGTFKKLRGQARITEENITQALRDVRMALIEADVALPVVKEVIETIKNAAIGQEVSLKLSPDQAFIKTVKNELVRIMGEENSALNLATQPPAVILMAGLQGSGKTTSSAKLARKLINDRTAENAGRTSRRDLHSVRCQRKTGGHHRARLRLCQTPIL